MRSTLVSMARSMRRIRLSGSSGIPELTGDGPELQSATPVSGAGVNSGRRAMLASLNRFLNSTWFRHWLYATCLFWIAGQIWHVRYEPIPWWTNGYTLTGTALLISFAVGLAGRRRLR
jgi:hypothetical protein